MVLKSIAAKVGIAILDLLERTSLDIGSTVPLCMANMEQRGESQ